MKDKGAKSAAITGILAAIAASSCCIPPLIALVAGVGGGASSLSWMEPLRPYLIGFAVLAIGYAWYAHLKPKAADDCGCEIEKPKFYQKRGFLIGMTLFAVVAITLPYYSGIFYGDNSKEVMVSDETNVETIEVLIDGMTCEACKEQINQAVNELDGIISVESSYVEGNALVVFDKAQVTETEIEAAVNSTGYKAIAINELDGTELPHGSNGHSCGPNGCN